MKDIEADNFKDMRKELPIPRINGNGYHLSQRQRTSPVTIFFTISGIRRCQFSLDVKKNKNSK